MTAGAPAAAFRPWLDRWRLEPDGAAIVTPTAQLLPVRREGAALMLKLSDTADARRGAALMQWWAGVGAAHVAASDGPALLIERATGTGNLAVMARGGKDAEACRILCAGAARLHRQRPGPIPALIPLDNWFADLFPFAATQGGVWAKAAATARRLLAAPRDVTVLHGDLHHGNLLDFGPHGWLAIDPHALWGERGFDFGNIFPNPDLDDPDPPLAVLPPVFTRRVGVVATTAGLEPRRLLEWVLARSGLSAAWFAEDDDPLIAVEKSIAEQAAAALGL